MMHHDEILSNNSFFKLYLTCRKIPDSKLNIYTFLFSFLIILILNLSTESKTNDIIEGITSFSNNFIGWVFGIIGFCLSGYAIFATLSNPEMQIFMSKKTKNIKNLEINYLKYVHCTFIKIIIDMLIITFLTFFLSREFFINAIFTTSSPDFPIIYFIFLKVLVSLFYSFFILILLLTKSFVYNVYYSVMLTIKWHSQAISDNNENQIDEKK